MTELFGCPFKGSREAGGVTSHILAIIWGCAAQMGGFYTQKNMGLISTPPHKKKKKIPKRGLNLKNIG